MNLYDVLGVPRNATAKALHRAYRKLSRELHPDRNPGDAAAEARYKEVQSAYEVLSDPARRAEYDATGSTRRPPPKTDAETARLEIVARLMFDVLGGVIGETWRNPADVDVLELMKSRIRTDLRNARDQEQRLQRAAAVVAAVRGRFGGPPAAELEDALKARAASVRNEIEKAAAQVRETADLLAYLDGVTYRKGTSAAAADGMVRTSAAFVGVPGLHILLGE